jgi:hypothetical protein
LVSLPKKGDLERHYKAPHSNKYDADFTPKSEIRKLKLKEQLEISCSTIVYGKIKATF